jgi:simple sugar transport system permease protein
MAEEVAPASAFGRRPVGNRGKPPSLLVRYGSQMGIVGVGVLMWLGFVVAAPRVFTDVDIYLAFAETTPLFGIVALSLTFVVISGEIDMSFPSVMALGTATFCLTTAYGGAPWWVGVIVGLLTGVACGILNGVLVATLNIPSMVITIGTQFLFRGLELVLMNGTGVPLLVDKYPEMHALLREPVFGFPVQTLWMIGFLIFEWILLNRTQFGAHVFLVGDNITSARLTGVNAGLVKIKAFVLVGVTAVFCGMLSSVYGYYFWPSTGDGSLLSTMASVFLGGTSAFGGTGSVVGTFVAAFIIGSINAGVISAGVNAFYTQLAFGLVIVLSVVLQTLIDRRIRRQSLTGL